MSLLEKAKQAVKEKKKAKLSPMEQLLKDPDVIKAARYLVKHMSQSEARNKLNELLEAEDKLPRTKKGKVVKITYQRFKSLLPKHRKAEAEEE